MLSEDQLDLIQRDVDGDLTPAEQLRLRALLETDADARARLVALRAVATELEAAPAFDVSAWRRGDVAVTAHRASPRHGWISAARARNVAAAAAAVTGELEGMMSRRCTSVVDQRGGGRTRGHWWITGRSRGSTTMPTRPSARPSVTRRSN